jgi:hypothetical protein
MRRPPAVLATVAPTRATVAPTGATPSEVP